MFFFGFNGPKFDQQIIPIKGERLKRQHIFFYLVYVLLGSNQESATLNQKFLSVFLEKCDKFLQQEVEH